MERLRNLAGTVRHGWECFDSHSKRLIKSISAFIEVVFEDSAEFYLTSQEHLLIININSA
jgi:hypothetical protein